MRSTRPRAARPDCQRAALLAWTAKQAQAGPAAAFSPSLRQVRAAALLRDLFVHYVLLGHSERRRLFGETDEIVNRKVRAAHEAALHPIVCVGETLEQRDKGNVDKILSIQLRGSLAGNDEDACADDRADAEQHKVLCREHADEVRLGVRTGGDVLARVHMG